MVYNIDELYELYFRCLTFGVLLHEEFCLNRRVCDARYKYGTDMICFRIIDGKPVRAEIFKEVYNG